MSEQHLRPGPAQRPPPELGAADPDEGEPRNPWDLREETGIARALWRTLRLLLASPVEAYRRTRPRGGYRGPLVFAFLVCFVAGFASELFDALYQLAVDPGGSGNLGDMLDVQLGGERLGAIEWLPETLLGAASFAGCVFGLAIGLPVFALLLPPVLFVWVGILHLCLKIVGGLRESEAGFQGTWASVCYATAAFVPGVLPVVGEWLSFFWLGLLQGIGFWILHRTTPRRAALALLLPFTIPLVLWLLTLTGVVPIESGAGP